MRHIRSSLLRVTAAVPGFPSCGSGRPGSSFSSPVGPRRLSVRQSPSSTPSEHATRVHVPFLQGFLSWSELSPASAPPAERAGCFRSKELLPAPRSSATRARFPAKHSSRMLPWCEQEWFRYFDSFGWHTCLRSGARSAVCPLDAHVGQEPSVGKHAAGSTSRCGTCLLRPFASGLGELLRSREHPPAVSACCPAARIHAPAGRAAIWLAVREEHRQLRPETGCLYRPARNGQVYA